MRFKEGAKVDFSKAKNLPSQLDVSMCSHVKFFECNLKNVEQLVFKNREQMEESGIKLPDDWKGKLVFAEQKKGRNLMKDATSEKSSAHNRWGGFVCKLFGKGSR